MMPSILALIEAGTVREDDNTLAIIQNVTSQQAHAITKWLALATNTPAYCRFMQIGQLEEEQIRYTPEEVRASAQQPQEQRTPRHCGHCGRDWKDCVCTPQDLE